MSNKPQPRCTVMLPGIRSAQIEPRECGRMLSDPCEFCKAWDDKGWGEEWAAVFNEYRSPPRVAVPGDIL